MKRNKKAWKELKISDEERTSLRALARKTTCHKTSDKIKIILAVADGRDLKLIA
jgi:hypothetical protein